MGRDRLFHTGKALARRSDFRNRAGHALTGQYLGAFLDLAVSSALPNLQPSQF
jgi:hypothetical protein